MAQVVRVCANLYAYGSQYFQRIGNKICVASKKKSQYAVIDEIPPPRTLGTKFKNPNWDDGYGGQISKKHNTGSANYTLESFGINSNLLSQLISNLEHTKHEKIQSKETKKNVDVDYWFRVSKGMKEHNVLYQEKKLSLVLDLDHTLLHSIMFHEIDSMQEQMMRKEEEIDRQRRQRHLFCVPYLRLWTKLRPGIWTFLKQASKLYNLHICTMGSQIYAIEMARLLDPTGELFGRRIISKCGNARKDLIGVLGSETTAVIMDDTVIVWPEHKRNLIHMGRYVYCPYKGDEHPEDGILASSLTVIEKIHTNFFSNQYYKLDEVDVRHILAAEKGKVLEGFHILFSSIFPMEEPNPDEHPLWQTAQQFGAICTTEMDSHVTRVVSKKIGTHKVNWALATGRFIVSPNWITTSVFLYKKANEKKFPVN